MLYYYIDESYRQDGEDWHCTVGGAVLPAEDVVDTESALEEAIYQLAVKENQLFNVDREFKYSNFFRRAPDEFKLRVCAELSEVMRTRNVKFLVSHAWIHESQLPLNTSLGPPSRQVQQLSFFNIPHYLAPVTQHNTVQMIIDLGISESFRPVYDTYAGMLRSIPMMRARGITDDQITIAHYRRLPMPTFLESVDSRILQFSDLLIGLLLCQQIRAETDFKAQLLAALEPIRENVHLFSVRWNADQSP